MKRTLTLAFLFAALLTSSASLTSADPACKGDDLSWLLPAAAAVGDSEAPLDLASTDRGTATRCTATANCGTSTVSCTVSTGSCTAVDRACPTTPGYVTCGSTTTFCPACACTNGTKRYTTLSYCCYNEVANKCRKALREELCVNGNWIYNDVVCEGLNCTGNCPL